MHLKLNKTPESVEIYTKIIQLLVDNTTNKLQMNFVTLLLNSKYYKINLNEVWSVKRWDGFELKVYNEFIKKLDTSIK